MSIGTIAAEAFAAMMRELDRKHGKYGEAACNALKEALTEMHAKAAKASAVIKRLKEENGDLITANAEAQKLYYAQLKENQRLTAIVAARDGGIKEVDANPYEEDPEP